MGNLENSPERMRVTLGCDNNEASPSFDGSVIKGTLMGHGSRCS
jgi:hypothetical protein